MNNNHAEYDVMFLHVHKQHMYEAIAGASAAGLKTAFVTPLYNRGLTRALFGSMPNRVGKMVREHEDARFAKVDIVTSFPWSFGRVFVNYAWHGGQGRLFKVFDRWCAARIRSGRFRARIFYVFQDYLPATCAAAKDAGSLLVNEQILNNSLKAQQRVLESARRVSFPAHCPEYPHDQTTNERLLKLADRVILPCSYVRQDIEEEVNADRIWEVPYGAPAPTPRASTNGSTANGGKPVLIIARATGVRKGGHLLFEALLSRSAEELFPGYSGEVKILMMGNIDPQFLPAVKQIGASQPRVTITHGHIPHQEVTAALAQADFFILPSLSESTSLAVLEAAAAGLPLVITPYCGLDGFVDGVHGVLVSEPSADGVARAIREMFLQRDKWPDFGRKAQSIVEGHPWSEFGDQIGAHLRSLIP